MFYFCNHCNASLKALQLFKNFTQYQENSSCDCPGAFSANVLKYVDIPSKIEILLSHLKDPVVEVREAGCQASVQYVNEKLIPSLLKNLEDGHTYNDALKALVTQGTMLIHYIREHFDQFSSHLKEEAVKLLKFIKEEKSLNFLEQILEQKERRIFHETLSSLKHLGYKALNKKQLKLIKNLLQEEKQNIVTLKRHISSLNSKENKALCDLLNREIELTQERSFLMLTFIYPETSIEKAMKGLSIDDEDIESYATEILIQTLSPEDKKNLIAELLYRPYAEKQKNEEHPNKETLIKILEYAPACYIKAMPSAVIYTIGSMRLASLKEEVSKYESKTDPFIKEMKAWTLTQL